MIEIRDGREPRIEQGASAHHGQPIVSTK